MPKVGDRHFSYGKKGKAAARRHAARTNQKVKNQRIKGKSRGR